MYTFVFINLDMKRKHNGIKGMPQFSGERPEESLMEP